MAHDDGDDIRIRPGRSRGTRSRGNPRDLPFTRQVELAVRKAGGNPGRIGGRKGGSGRFNAHGRGAKAVASFPRDGGSWQRDSIGRFRSRRVVVKARVVKLAPQRGSRGSKVRGVSQAADAHLRYLERDGVTRDGEKGRAYSALENEADGRAFIERGREDRHQFRLIVAPEDSVEMDDLRGFTRDLMRRMEQDLDTRLDWIAVDHHNTGHPHTHIIVRGVLDDGRILNIAGDYIAHGIRHRASELVTLELGPQTEIDIARKLASEVEAERLTRLDRMLIAESRERGMVDLRPDAAESYTTESYMGRANRHLLIDRAKRLERYGLATEAEPGRWTLSDEAEPTLKALGERNDIIKTMHRALAEHGLAEARGPSQYVTHGNRIAEPVMGRVLAKGLAGDELGDRLHLVIDGVDGRTHYVETADASTLDEIRRGHIVSLDPAPTKAEPRPADLNIRTVAEANGGIYRPSLHREATREIIERRRGDPDAFIRSHVRRLEALRRAGHVERIDADHWKIPEDIAERGMAYDAPRRPKDFAIRTLSTLDLDRQLGSDGATWLDRELAGDKRTPLGELGFGREVKDALRRRAERLVEMGLATDSGKTITIKHGAVAKLERQEVDRVGQEMAAERGLAYAPSGPGEYVSGRLAGVAALASGRFAMIDDGIGFQLVPWQPVLEKRLDQHIGGVRRDDGGIGLPGLCRRCRLSRAVGGPGAASERLGSAPAPIAAIASSMEAMQQILIRVLIALSRRAALPGRGQRTSLQRTLASARRIVRHRWNVGPLRSPLARPPGGGNLLHTPAEKPFSRLAQEAKCVVERIEFDGLRRPT
jgi:type IV secretory pathway VirD2 relaxase